MRDARCAGVRWGFVAMFALLGCGGLPRIAPPEIPPPVYPETYNTRIANLRTTLGRSGIALRVAGIDKTFETVRDTKCVLAGETTRVDGTVLEATTHAFSLYPTDVLEAAKIEYVALCTDLEQESDIAHPAGVADVESHGLLISLRYFIDWNYSSDGKFTVDDIVHHELFHLIEGAHYLSDMASDSEWQLFNPLGFEYVQKGTLAGGGIGKEPRRDGFVNSYAMTNVMEDKASTYEFMMSRSLELCELAREDETLKVKSRIIWRRLLKAVGTDAFLRMQAPCIDWLEN